MVKQFEGHNIRRYVMFTAQRSEISKAVERKIGRVYGGCFGKREYWLAQFLARAKVKWGT